MQTPEKWYRVLVTQFGSPFRSSDPNSEREEAKEWFIEIRKSIYGWESDNPLKDSLAATVNREICESIRWAAKQDITPRARKTSQAKICVADIVHWVIIWKKNQPKKAPITGVTNGYAAEAIRVIRWLLSEGRRYEAAIAVSNPDVFGSRLCYGENAFNGASRGPSGIESQRIREWCNANDFDFEEILRTPLIGFNGEKDLPDPDEYDIF